MSTDVQPRPELIIQIAKPRAYAVLPGIVLSLNESAH
jgi:hypothetical protein